MRNNFASVRFVAVFSLCIFFWAVEILFHLFRVYRVEELTRNFAERNAQRASLGHISNVDLVVFSFTFTGVELKETLSLFYKN